MDVSTHPAHDTPAADRPRGQTPARSPGDGGADLQARPTVAGAPGRGRPRRSASTLVALACFTVPAVVLWWHVWSGHPTVSADLRLRRPGAGGLVHGLARLGHHPPAQPLLLGRGQRPPRRQPACRTRRARWSASSLAPVTWLFGPVAATNVALTLAPALSAWGCFAAIRPLVTWKAAAIPAALVFGYSAAIVTSLTFGHVSVTVLVIPPFLFTTLHEIVIRQEHSVRRDGLLLAALLVVQFFISPEILVMCLLLGVRRPGWRSWWSAGASCGRAPGTPSPPWRSAAGVTVVVLAYPAWFGLAGPQAVTGVLFALAPISGVPLSGLLAPGQYGALANEYIRFGGYLGRTGPPPDYVGGGRRPGRGGGRSSSAAAGRSPGCSCSWRP